MEYKELELLTKVFEKGGSLGFSKLNHSEWRLLRDLFEDGFIDGKIVLTTKGEKQIMELAEKSLETRYYLKKLLPN